MRNLGKGGLTAFLAIKIASQSECNHFGELGVGWIANGVRLLTFLKWMK